MDTDLEAGTEADTEWAQASLRPSAEMAVAARLSALHKVASEPPLGSAMAMASVALYPDGGTQNSRRIGLLANRLDDNMTVRTIAVVVVRQSASLA